MPPKTKAHKPSTPKTTTEPLQAEANPGEYLLRFSWRGHEFTVDAEKTQFGRAAYALRQASNDNKTLFDRVNAGLDAFESLLGEDQVAELIKAEPRVLDDEEIMGSF